MAHLNPPIIHLETTDSTNREAFRLLEKSWIEEGTAILARHQSAGRGQGKTSWESEPGKNLTFSIIFRPLFLAPASQFLLNQAIALGVREGIATLLPSRGPVLVKWPNDIFWNNHKVSGTLIENQVMGNQLKVSVAGIGININQESFSPAAPLAISLKTIAGREFDLDAAFRRIYDSILNWYQVLREENHTLIREAYLNHMLGLNETRRFAGESGTFSGVIKGLDQYGRISVQLTDGQQIRFDIKEISFLF